MNKKAYLLSILFFVAFSSVKAQYFEGKITYSIKVNYKGVNSRNKQYYESEKFGDTMLVYINKEGFIRREFPTSGRLGGDFNLYNPIENKQYASFRFTDSIYWYTADTNFVNDLKIVKCTEQNDMYYNGERLMCIGLSGYDQHLDSPIRSEYYYLPNRYLFNFKSWLKNKDFLQGSIYGESKSNFMVIHTDYGNYEFTMKAVSVVESEIDESKFLIPKNTPMKKQ